MDVLLFVKIFSVPENDKLINQLHFSKVTYQVFAFQNWKKIVQIFLCHETVLGRCLACD